MNYLRVCSLGVTGGPAESPFIRDADNFSETYSNAWSMC